jgi:hypothetical protein
MGINVYTKKIEEYLSKKESNTKELDSARGLLSPKSMKPAEIKKQKDMTETIGDFVYALRLKRKEIVAQREGNKNGRK